MKGAECAQQLAFGSITRYQAGTWAPFLFQTTTIKRWRGQDWKSSRAGYNNHGHYVGFDEDGKPIRREPRFGKQSVGPFNDKRSRTIAREKQEKSKRAEGKDYVQLDIARDDQDHQPTSNEATGLNADEEAFQKVLQSLEQVDSSIAQASNSPRTNESWRKSADDAARAKMGGDADISSISKRYSRSYDSKSSVPEFSTGRSRDRVRHMKNAEKQQRPKTSRKESPVPFAHMMDKEGPEHDPNERLQGTTVTRSEMSMFEKLLALRDPKNDVPKVSKDGSVEKSLNEKVADAVGVKIAMPEDKVNEPVQVVREHKRKPQTPAELKYEGVVRRVTALMNDAQTDSRLWAILQEEAFAPLIALDLDGRIAGAHKAERPETEDQQIMDTLIDPSLAAPVQQVKESTAETQNKLQTLAYTLPRLLVAFYSFTNRSFQNSGYQLALLPYLKSLGPTSFALGVTTDLYNQHLGVLYRNTLDLQGILDTLSDMHRQVVSYDSRTLDLVSKIARKAEAYHKNLSDPMQAVWGGHQKETFIEPFKQWAIRIQESLNEEALDAMANANDEDDASIEGMADIDNDDDLVEDQTIDKATTSFA